MINRFKKYILEKIYDYTTLADRTEKKRLWQDFISKPDVTIHTSQEGLSRSNFKGNGNFFGKISIGENFNVRDYCNFLVFPNAELVIGNRVFFNNYCSINCLEKISIGDDTLIGEGVKFYDHNHSIETDNSVKFSKAEFSKAPILIGKNCWIASNVTILKGVTIGDNCIIGAGCTIHKSIPQNSIVKNQQNLIIETING